MSQLPFCNPFKNPHLHHQLHCRVKKQCFYYFCHNLHGLFGPLISCLGQSFFTEETAKQTRNLPTSSIFFLSFCPFSLYFLNIQTFLYFSPPLFYIHPYLHIQDSNFLWQGFLIFCDLIWSDLMSKKTKGVSLDSRPSYGGGVYEDTRARLKHQSLLQDYQELQKVFPLWDVFLLVKDLKFYSIICFLAWLWFITWLSSYRFRKILLYSVVSWCFLGVFSIIA